jgi:hypothetical protein
MVEVYFTNVVVAGTVLCSELLYYGGRYLWAETSPTSIVAGA